MFLLMFLRLDFMTFKILYLFKNVKYLQIEKNSIKKQIKNGVFGSTIEKMINPAEYEVIITKYLV